EFGFAGDDSREMEDHVGTLGDQLFGKSRHREIASDGLDRKAGIVRLHRRHHVLQRHFGDVLVAEPAVAQQPFDQLAPDHAGRAENEHVQEKLLRFLLMISGYRAGLPAVTVISATAEAHRRAPASRSADRPTGASSGTGYPDAG